MLTVPQMDQTEFTFEFNDQNVNWASSLEYNLLYLKAQIQYFNDKLNIMQGPLFLNDALDALGFARIPAGQVVGWAPGGEVRIEVINSGTRLILRMYVDGVVLTYL